jgi:pimeloyl-ACP methyl ester carboxylesterase
VERLDVADLHFADELPEGRTFDLPGRGTAFVRIAAGPAGAPTVLLLHGLFATADLNWSLAVPALATRFNVVAPDIRGHGRGLSTERFSGEECSDDLAAIVQTLGLGRVIVVGYSLGGLIAQLFVRRHPEMVAGIVLCATASKFDVPTEGGVIRLVEQAVRRVPEPLRRSAMLALLAPKSADSPRGKWLMSEVRRHDTLALLDAISEAAKFDSASWLGTCTCPAAVIVTQDDMVVSPQAQRELATLLGRSSVHEVPGDHFACVKRPAEFNEALVAACAGVQE